MSQTNQSTNLPVLLETLPTVKNQSELNNALQSLKQHFNVLVPAQMNFSSPMHKVALEAVQLDPTVDDKKNGVDIYSPDGNDKYTLHYKAANKIAGAAGINWVKSFATQRDKGENGRVIYVEHVVEWEVKKTNGSTKKGVTTGHYSYEEDKAKFSARPKMIETRRRFAEGLAESNAKLRAIFEALEQLPRSFTLDEVRKPFLVPCVVEDINELAKEDPEIRKMIAANSLGIIDKVYGKESPRQDMNLIHGASAEVIDEHPSTTAQQPVTAAAAQVDIEKQNIEIWTGMSPAQRFKELVSLANKIGKPLTFAETTYAAAPLQRQLNGLTDYWKQAQKIQSTKKETEPALPDNW